MMSNFFAYFHNDAKTEADENVGNPDAEEHANVYKNTDLELQNDRHSSPP